MPRTSGSVVVGCELEAKSQVVYPVRVEGSRKGVWLSGIRYQVSGVGGGYSGADLPSEANFVLV